MRLSLPALLLTVLSSASPIWADEPDDSPAGAFRQASEAIWDYRSVGVGSLLPDLELSLADGSSSRLSELVAPGLTVLVARDADCPLGRRMAPNLAELQAQFGNSVRFAWLLTQRDGGAEQATAAVQDQGLDGPVILDPALTVAAALGLTTSTEALVIDAGRTLRYRGAADDQYGIGFAQSAASQLWLADALELLLDGRRPRVSASTAPGCVLELPLLDVEPERAVTWHADISRVLQDRCNECHRADGVAPFALETYSQARAKSGMLRFVTDHGVMPPWGATPGSGPWRNDRSLAAADKAALDAWIAADCPEGDPADAPLPRGVAAGWDLGQPDAVYTGPAVPVPASGTVPYQYFYLRTSESEDRWVSAIQVRPGAQQQVHHVLIFQEAPLVGYDGSVSTGDNGGSGGLHGYWAGYIPGQGARDFGPGRAKLLPAGSWLKFQMHYTTNGAPATDQTSLGLWFAEEPPAHEVLTSALSETRLRIPPRTDDVVVTASGKFGGGAVLAGFSPHMHLRGKAFRFDLLHADGSEEVLLDIPAYDFNWQTMYELAEPRELPAGAGMRVTAWFDNSADNPANPDPNAEVYFGEQTWDEMMIGYFEWWRP